MKLDITLILDSEKEKSALIVISRLNKIISAGSPTFESYHKGGTRALLVKDLPELGWADAYLASVSIAQSFGHSWTLLGRAQEELNLVGNEFRIAGIEWAELSLIR